MFIFAGDYVKTVVPESKIYNIRLVGKTISINYDGGEITYLSDSDANAVAPKIETINLTYETEEIATDVLRSFYVACRDKENAFYF